MRINVELDEEETALLLMMLGAGTASLRLPMAGIDSMLAIVNKLMGENPNYRPYDVSRQRTQ